MRITRKKKLTYGDWLNLWIEEQRLFIKESTFATYVNIIENHIKHDLGSYFCNQLTEEILQDFIIQKLEHGRLDNKGGLSVKTVRDIVIICKSSIKSAAKQGYATLKSFDLKIPKAEKPAVSVFENQDINQIIAYANNQDSRILGIIISIYTGLRIGEVCGLKWQDIDMIHHTIIVQRTIQRIYIKQPQNRFSKVIETTPKTRSSQRVLPINSALQKILQKHMQNNDCYVVSGTPFPIEPRTYRNYFSSILKQLGIERKNYHSLRHTFATKCIEVGVDYKTVSELLGHSNVSLTLNLYVHPRMEQKRECVELINVF